MQQFMFKNNTNKLPVIVFCFPQWCLDVLRQHSALYEQDHAVNVFSVFLQRDKVDAVSLDATHAFIAGKCGFVPVVTEYYGK